jgi:hypothetical protein
MATTEFHNLVGQAGTYNSTGPKIDLDGAAKDDHVTFVTSVTSTSEVYVLIKKDATNLLVWKATFTDAATDTLALVGSALTTIGTISNSDSVDCYLINPADVIKRNYEGSKGFLVGLGLEYVSTTSIKCLEGQAVVNGELLTVPSAGLTTMTGDALSLATNSQGDIFYIYLYDDAGTVKLHRNVRVNTGDDPVWDTDLDYAKHPDDGAAKRCIGAVYVGSVTDDLYDVFSYTVNGRNRQYIADQETQRVVSAANTAGVNTAVDCSSAIPATSICPRAGWRAHCRNDHASVDSIIVVQLGNTSTFASGIQVSAFLEASSQAAALGPMVMPNPDPAGYYYKSVDRNGTAAVFIDMTTWEMYV